MSRQMLQQEYLENERSSLAKGLSISFYALRAKNALDYRHFHLCLSLNDSGLSQ